MKKKKFEKEIKKIFKKKHKKKTSVYAIQRVKRKFRIENFPEFPKEVRVSNFPKHPEPQKIEIPEYPKEIKISNLKEIPKQKFPEIPKFPEKVDIKKPNWLNKILKAVRLDKITVQILDSLREMLDESRDPDNAIAVKLVSTQGQFYNARGGGGGAVIGAPSNVGLLDSNDARINPAKEDGNLADIKTNTDASTDMEGGGQVAVGTTAVEATFTGTTRSIIISADTSNTGTLYVGKSNVTSAGANAIAFLEAGESIVLEYNDTSNAIYVVSDTATQNFWKGALI